MDALEFTIMEPVIIGCDQCGKWIRILRPNVSFERNCPHCETPIDQKLGEVLAAIALGPKPFQLAEPPESHFEAFSDPPDDPAFKRRPWDLGIHPPACAYAASLLFLMITASLFADAIGSLDSHEPGYQYRIVRCGQKNREDDHAESSRRPGHGSGTKVASGCFAEPPVLADLPDDVFAGADPLGPITLSGHPRRDPCGLFGASSSHEARSHAICPTRIKIRDPEGRVMVARFHGAHGGEVRFILPDGQLGIPTRQISTTEPFRPLTHDELHDQLKCETFSTFESFKTSHYLIFFQPKSEESRGFAERSGELLENLYKGLTETFRKREIPIHDVEFPLVVVIFDSEKEFRAHKKVAPDVQAYYEIFTNRIYFYETSEHDHLAPEIATLRKPQTVAHEGTHQILANIGVQPRLAAWPIWLTEGLAEYCASPIRDHEGNITWNGLGKTNALHMATIRDLKDPGSTQVRSRRGHVSRTGRDPGKPLVENLIRAEQLSPTDYALAWALTHYLALKRGDDFVKYLVEMGTLRPLEPRTADEQVEVFKKHFGADLTKLDKQIATYLVKLEKEKGYDPLPYYAVMFEQTIGREGLRRAALVSQSPSMIQQWLQEMSAPRGVSRWNILEHPSRARAVRTAEVFMQGY